jgi:hypothetical protein
MRGVSVTVLSSATLLIFTCLLAASCIDPESDYDDYVSRTADQHSPPPMSTGDSDPDAPLFAPDAGFMDTYFESCLSTNAEGNPAQANDFKAVLTFTASTTNPGGTLTLSSHPIAEPGGTSLSDTVGVVSSSTGTVSPDGTVILEYGPYVIPGSANPITDMDIDFMSSSVRLHVESPDHVCGNLTGPATVGGISLALSATCIFVRNPPTPLPSFELSDYHCP